jgi:hypothetical protein
VLLKYNRCGKVIVESREVLLKRQVDFMGSAIQHGTFGRALTSYVATVALRVAYTRPIVGQQCIVGNGMLSRVFVGLNKMLT